MLQPKNRSAILAPLALLAILLFPLQRVAAAQSSATVPITGTVNGVAAFVGSFTVTRFHDQSGSLMASGLLNGTLTDPSTGATQTVSNVQALLPVSGLSATCQILTLHLGPIHLDLLGLVVDLSQVTLTITAQQGPGNLLGNLLCSLAHALDSNATLQSIVALLNQILAAL